LKVFEENQTDRQQSIQPRFEFTKMFAKNGTIRSSALPSHTNRTKQTGVILHSTTRNSNQMFASGTPSILRDTPVAFGSTVSSRPRSNARSLASNHVAYDRYPKLSDRMARLAEPKRVRQVASTEQCLPFYPAGARIAKEPEERSFTPSRINSPFKPSQTQPTAVDRPQPPNMDTSVEPDDTWDTSVRWFVDDRCHSIEHNCNGTVRWVGVFSGNGMPMVGVELDYGVGDTDGVFWDKFRLFQCDEGHGILVTSDDLTTEQEEEEFEPYNKEVVEIDSYRPLADLIEAAVQPEAPTEHEEYLQQQRIERRKSIADAGFSFNYEEYEKMEGLMAWDVFKNEEGYDGVPLGLIRLLYDYYLEESEQCHKLQEALAYVTKCKAAKPFSKAKMDEARQGLESHIDRGLGIQQLHHEELEKVCAHVEFTGDLDGLILHTGGILEGNDQGPAQRSMSISEKRNEHIQDRMLESQKQQQLELVMHRIESLKLNPDHHSELQQLANDNLLLATNTLDTLERQPAHKDNAQRARVAQMASQWEHLKVEHEVIRDRVSQATPSKRLNDARNQSGGLHHAASNIPSGHVTEKLKMFN